ncbi:hypothetical protein DRN85_08125 [Methanosarcinales archaeon]|nr:MAG: hypothetical protein DRN85_08125 [Methanosarcinales archaeon]
MKSHTHFFVGWILPFLSRKEPTPSCKSKLYSSYSHPHPCRSLPSRNSSIKIPIISSSSSSYSSSSPSSSKISTSSSSK